MENELTLNETWDLCLKMWTWVYKNFIPGTNTINELKEQWMSDHGFENLQHNCFFCEYALHHPISYNGDPCFGCPGALIDDTFRCDNMNYDYHKNPYEFLFKLKNLNVTRLRKDL